MINRRPTAQGVALEPQTKIGAPAQRIEAAGLEAARDRMRDAGELGADVHVAAERGARNFAPGDRIMFLKNERGLGVKNGTLGTIEQVSTQSMTVRTDDGRDVAFDLTDYDRIDHGYAATIHKAQGMTVDCAHVLARPAWTATAAMSPYHGTATVWTCTMVMTTSPGKTTHQHPVARPGQGHGDGLRIRPRLRRAARHHLP